jgi:hypothetical protein
MSETDWFCHHSIQEETRCKRMTIPRFLMLSGHKCQRAKITHALTQTRTDQFATIGQCG